MESNHTEEIICTNCGRPNLLEAEKCWYCQAPLKKEAQDDPAVEEGRERPAAESQQKDHREEAHDRDSEGEIPDWLKRIRELRQQDMAVEEETDQWQQQVLFEDSAKSKDKPPAKKQEPKPAVNKTQEPSSTEKQVPKSQPSLEVNEAAGEKIEQSQPPNDKKGEDSENQPEELPDGFVKFDPKSS